LALPSTPIPDIANVERFESMVQPEIKEELDRLGIYPAVERQFGR
jgi:hypothetical protein